MKEISCRQGSVMPTPIEPESLCPPSPLAGRPCFSWDCYTVGTDWIMMTSIKPQCWHQIFVSWYPCSPSLVADKFHRNRNSDFHALFSNQVIPSSVITSIHKTILWQCVKNYYCIPSFFPETRWGPCQYHFEYITIASQDSMGKVRFAGLYIIFFWKHWLLVQRNCVITASFVPQDSAVKKNLPL